MGNSQRPNVHKRMDNLEQKIDKRPTLLTIVTLLFGVIGIILSASYFITGKLLSAQSETLKAETKVCVLEAMNKHNELESQTWAQRKDRIIKDILAYLKLQSK